MERIVSGSVRWEDVFNAIWMDFECPDTAPAAPDLDIPAVDQASVDMIYALPENQRHDLVERIESRGGLRQLSSMREQGMGNHAYDLITL